MTDSTPDDARLHSVEAQMRHALGLHGDAPSRPTPNHPVTTTIGSPVQRRRFVQDGEVPVTVVRRDHHVTGDTGTNQLDVARAAVRTAAAARERAERLLDEAQSTIRTLQTKVAHERLAKDEAVDAVRRAETETQSVRAELAIERDARRVAERERELAVAGRHTAERQLRDALAAQQTRAAPKREAPVQSAAAGWDDEAGTIEAVRPVVAAVGKKRGRKPKAQPVVWIDDAPPAQPNSDGETDADVVEWWKPGWRQKLR